VVRQFQRLLSPIRRRIQQLFTRSVVRLVDSTTLMQSLQLEVLKGETIDGIEHAEPYGFTSCPKAGAEAFIAAANGNRSHSIALVVADRRYRITGLQAGEVAIYTDEGDNITIKRGGNIEVSAATKITLNSPQVECTGALSVAGNVTAGGDVSDATGSMQAIRDVYNTHTHNPPSSETAAPNQSM